MAAESARQAGEDKIGTLIDDLIQDIMSESGGGSSGTPERGGYPAGMLEAVFSGRGAARAPALERFLIAEAFAGELADALAPALAEQIAPRLLKAMEQLMAAEPAGKQKQAPSAPRTGGGHGRKPDGK